MYGFSSGWLAIQYVDATPWIHTFEELTVECVGHCQWRAIHIWLPLAMSSARLFPTQSKWMNLNITLKWYDQSHRGWCISPRNVAPNHGKHNLPMALTKCIQIWFVNERIVHHDLNWILFTKSITLLQVGCVIDHAVTSGSELSSCTLSSP